MTVIERQGRQAVDGLTMTQPIQHCLQRHYCETIGKPINDSGERMNVKPRSRMAIKFVERFGSYIVKINDHRF